MVTNTLPGPTATEAPMFGPELAGRVTLLYHYCRTKLPTVQVTREQFRSHLERSYQYFRKVTLDKEKRKKSAPPRPCDPAAYLAALQPRVLDWYVCAACLQSGRDRTPWDILFSTRTSGDRLLVDSLKASAVSFYPRNAERQQNIVDEFWGHLLVPAKEGSLPILARYSGSDAKLVPWLIRVFENWIKSILRGEKRAPEELADEEHNQAAPPATPIQPKGNEAFCEAAQGWIDTLNDRHVLILGLVWNWRMTQREVANVIQRNEGNVSRALNDIHESWRTYIAANLDGGAAAASDSWNLVLTEMGDVLATHPRLSGDGIGRILAARGLTLPDGGAD